MSDDTLVDFGLSSESALAEWWKGKLMMYETGSVAFLPQRAPYLLWSKTYTSNIQKTISNFPCSLKSHKDPSEGVQASGFFYHRALNIWPFSEVSEVSESHCWRQAHSWAQRAGGLREGAPLHCHRWLKNNSTTFQVFSTVPGLPFPSLSLPGNPGDAPLVSDQNPLGWYIGPHCLVDRRELELPQLFNNAWCVYVQGRRSGWVVSVADTLSFFEIRGRP